MRTRWLIPVALALAVTAAPARADPPEDENAWPDAPVGFHWDQLGPRTAAVDASLYAEVRHVSGSTGSDESGDGSAARPWKTVHRALAHLPASGRVAVFVATGTYAGDTLNMQERVDLYGGFELQHWQRDVGAHPTVLSGQGSQRVLVGADDSRLDGFVIEDGVFRGPGGGLLCDGVSPVIANNVFRRNRTLEPEGFPRDPKRRRVRGHDGGAIGLVNFARPDIRHNLFADNETGVGYGGAIGAAHDCIPVIAHNVFWGNRAGTTDRENTRSGNGGAIGLLFSSRPAIVNNLFVANETRGLGDGGAVFMEYFCWPEVQFNAFVNNSSADDGGGLDHQKFSYPKVRANLFYGNHATKSGGGTHMDDSTVELENNIFAYNRADREGGGIGGTHGWMHVRNNTVVYNEAARDGGGIQIVNVKNPFLRSSVFRNNIILDNRSEQLRLWGDVDVAYNIVHPGGYEAGYYNFDVGTGFRDDGRALSVRSARPDPARFTTTVTIDETFREGELVGRIVRSGTFWSMVRANRAHELTVWGTALPPESTAMDVLPTFHLTAESRAVRAGAYPDFPPTDIDGEPRYLPNIDAGADQFHAPNPAAP